ncbi:carbohydrate esterase family 4 protein [Coprinopsis sp. MPI-PUGE-AT-0042]|nr:carbohydrate esterase family 4 protein [Coprinopsis sp. MPI-PUGE-AT-0042]
MFFHSLNQTQRRGVTQSLLLILISTAIKLSTARSITKQTLANTNATMNLAEASSTDECAPYYYEADTNAEAKFESIRQSIPSISPKGTLTGDFGGVNYSGDDNDCWWTYSKCTTPKLEALPNDIADVPEPQTLGYGFDDGPNCSHNAFYDYLLSENQKATMFYIGSNVMDWPKEAKRGVEDVTAFSDRDAFAELYYTIKLVTDVTPTCWRPPFGDVDDRIRAIAQGLGLRTVLWKYDSNDWRMGSDGTTEEDVDKYYDTLLKDAKNGKFASNGVIILSHELNDFTMTEAVKYYQKLKKAFDNIVPIAVALNLTQPYIEDTVLMPSFLDYTSSDDAEQPGQSASLTSSTSSSGTVETPVTSGSQPNQSSDGRVNNDASPTVSPDSDSSAASWNGAYLGKDLACAFVVLAAYITL